MENNNTNDTVRKSYVITFGNHPPIRLWGYFEPRPANDRYSAGYGDCLIDYEDGTVWDSGQQWGHHTIDYYVCKSGKCIYWASYNCGESYNGRNPKTGLTFLRDAEAIKSYLIEHVGIGEWNRICHRIDPSLIVDSDLL